jgi:hypothetical protein
MLPNLLLGGQPTVQVPENAEFDQDANASRQRHCNCGNMALRFIHCRLYLVETCLGQWSIGKAQKYLNRQRALSKNVSSVTSSASSELAADVIRPCVEPRSRRR